MHNVYHTPNLTLLLLILASPLFLKKVSKAFNNWPGHVVSILSVDSMPIIGGGAFLRTPFVFRRFYIFCLTYHKGVALYGVLNACTKGQNPCYTVI